MAAGTSNKFLNNEIRSIAVSYRALQSRVLGTHSVPMDGVGSARSDRDMRGLSERVFCSDRRVTGIELKENLGDEVMLNWALTFLVVALIAGVFGFTGIAGTAAGMAKILFLVFLVLFLISIVIPKLRPPV